MLPATMSALLKQIQSDAVDASVPISNVLRKCAVLGAQLKNNELRDWAFKELNGYTGDDDVPPYRVIGAPTLANLHASGWDYKATPLASLLLPEKLQKHATAIEFGQPVAALEALIKGSDDSGTVMMPWPGDWVLWVQKEGKFAKGAHVIVHSIWQSASTAAVVGIIDTVRNRILEFCLRLGQETPELLEEHADVVPSPAVATAARDIYNQVFVIGDHTGNIANASPGATLTTGIAAGDLAGLIGELQALGVPQGDAEELQQAIAEGDANTLGPRVKKWLEKVPKAIGTGLWKVGSEVGVSVITKAVLAYYGIPS